MGNHATLHESGDARGSERYCSRQLASPRNLTRRSNPLRSTAPTPRCGARPRYVFEFVTSDGAKASFYLSASSEFTFSVTDIRNEPYPLEVKIGNDGIPIDQFVALFCEVGVRSASNNPAGLGQWTRGRQERG